MSTFDYLIIILPGFVASAGITWVAGMAQMEARKARELSEKILARLDQARADQQARDAAELAALRDLHRASGAGVGAGSGSVPGSGADQGDGRPDGGTRRA